MIFKLILEKRKKLLLKEVRFLLSLSLASSTFEALSYNDYDIITL